MPNVDSGSYFFTALVPICNDGIVEHLGMQSSPVHMVRDALETLPTALQEPGDRLPSPFARNLRTHFARFYVIDQPNFNGRDYTDALVNLVAGGDPLQAQQADQLACPYLAVMIDFDPIDTSGKGEPRAYLEEIWRQMEPELRAIFTYCYRFSSVGTAAQFADFMIACQVETTMPFHDYWIDPPALKVCPIALLAALPVIGLLAPILIDLLVKPIPAVLLLAILGVILGVVFDYRLLLWWGGRSFPGNPNATLRHVLKALYLQQRFTQFVVAQQGRTQAEQGAAFRQFLRDSQPSNLTAPTQQAGVARTAL